VEINHAREIDEIVNAISYNKGASVIRMLQSYLGAECLQVGVRFFTGISFLSQVKIFIIIQETRFPLPQFHMKFMSLKPFINSVFKKDNNRNFLFASSEEVREVLLKVSWIV